MSRTQPSNVTKRIVVDQVILMFPIAQFQKTELESSHSRLDVQFFCIVFKIVNTEEKKIFKIMFGWFRE
jgi:hypothetical protein